MKQTGFLHRMVQCVVVGWRLIREAIQIVYGMYKIMRLPRPCVSIFGGSRLAQHSHYAELAYECAKLLVEENIAVLTGGGPGIMESANCGAQSVKTDGQLRNIGIGITGMRHEKGLNPCVGERIVLDYFFARKWLLINYSVGFIVFPGGFGTLDELSDLLNVIHTQKRAWAPVVLIGVEFWKPYEAWLEQARREHLVEPIQEPVVLITDDLTVAMKYLKQHCIPCDKA